VDTCKPLHRGITTVRCTKLDMDAMEEIASLMLAFHLKSALLPGKPRDPIRENRCHYPDSEDLKALSEISQLVELAIRGRIAAEAAAPSANLWVGARMSGEAVRDLASAAFVMTHAGLLATGDYEQALERCDAWFAMVGR